MEFREWCQTPRVFYGLARSDERSVCKAFAVAFSQRVIMAPAQRVDARPLTSSIGCNGFEARGALQFLQG
eukprot:10667528-Lingulodinium_polyedra.AAC.1